MAYEDVPDAEVIKTGTMALRIKMFSMLFSSGGVTDSVTRSALHLW